jgi:hypothetical protein
LSGGMSRNLSGTADYFRLISDETEIFYFRRIIMNQSILDLREKLDVALQAVSSVPELESLKVEYLGKKGSITALLKNMGKLSVEEKKTFGSEVNALKDYATQAISAKFEHLQQLELQNETALVQALHGYVDAGENRMIYILIRNDAESVEEYTDDSVLVEALNQTLAALSYETK